MWVKLDDGWDEHPKILSVSEPAILMWIRAITYANRNKTGGYIPRGVLHKLTPSADSAALADELADVRAPGCKGGLFDRIESGAGFRVHDYEKYQPAQDTDAERGQGAGDLSAKRSAAGKRGAAARWRGGIATDGTLPPSADGTLPLANDGNVQGNTMATDGTAAPLDGPARAGLGPVGRSSLANHGNLPSVGMATFATPDPVSDPDPVLPPAHAGARGDTASPRGLATADVWLAAVRVSPSLALLHNDQPWAHEVEGTSAHRGTRAEDASASVLVFLEKNAGRQWNDRAELVRELGGFVAKAKEIGDDMRSRRARAEARSSAPAAPPPRANGHHHGTRHAPRGAPLPNPRAARDLELDLGDGAEPRKAAAR